MIREDEKIIYIEALNDSTKIVAKVDLEKKEILINKNEETAEILPQTYALHYLVEHFETIMVALATNKSEGLSNLSKELAMQVILQEGESKGLQHKHIQNIEDISKAELISILTDCFLSGVKPNE